MHGTHLGHERLLKSEPPAGLGIMKAAALADGTMHMSKEAAQSTVVRR